jgi:histidine triad (HIT) family protein
MRTILATALLALLAIGASAEETKPCVFCEIIAGRVPAAIVYRDDKVVAFLDHAPQNPGHVLVVPIEHAEDLLAIPADTAGHMMRVAQRVASAIRQTDIRSEGFRLTLNSGKSAGQDVPHAHLHVVPRFKDDDRRPIQPTSELERVAAKIRDGFKE